MAKKRFYFRRSQLFSWRWRGTEPRRASAAHKAGGIPDPEGLRSDGETSANLKNYENIKYRRLSLIRMAVGHIKAIHILALGHIDSKNLTLLCT